jgi:hypothetical protein
VFLLTPSVPAAADDVSGLELSQLVDAAQDSNQARADLDTITSVDGTAVDMGLVLDGLADDDTRLDTLNRLLRDSDPQRLDGPALRSEAAEILSNPPYAAEVAGNSSVFDRLWRVIAGLFGNGAIQGLSFVAIVAIALLVAIPVINRLVGRRQRLPEEAVASVAARDFAAEAVNAAGSGDFDEAVRLLFLDGAEYLERQRVVPSAATTSSSTVRPIVTDTRFLDRFDEIAYGGAEAANDDVHEARTSWQQLKRRVP